MQSKFLAVIVAAVVVTSAALYAYAANENNNGRDAEAEDDVLPINPGSDYKVLDSDSNVKHGVKYQYVSIGESISLTSSLQIDSVADGKYQAAWSYDDQIGVFYDDYHELSYFKLQNVPTQMGPFDARKAADFAGLTLSVDGNTYTVNGTWTDYETPYRFTDYSMTVEGDVYTLNGEFYHCVYGVEVTETYDSLVIEYDGTTVSSVSGGYSRTSTDSAGSGGSVYVFKTVDGTLLCTDKSHGQSDASGDVDGILDRVMSACDVDLSKAKDTGTTAALGNVQAKVYTYSGTYKIFPSEYQVNDLKIYVYDGVAIYIDGYSGDVHLSQSLTITHED